MFFHKKLTHTITLHPSFLGPRMREFVTQRLYEDVKDSCSGRYGYIVAVVAILEIKMGKIIPGIGSAEFDVQYSAILFRPFKNEVMDAVVSTVNHMGFFAKAGPLEIFVSQVLIPADMKFNPHSNPPSYQSEEQKIEVGTLVRVKISGARVDATAIFAIGTIKEDYLGVIE
ncbi:DNA-directed RNA polymerase II subunit [Coemansia spiralis]|uniref:DNA-directed RNA polymerase II subunit n=2 Tax=Coemansia TaxID=4863 RepID=A0A9W8GB31_9FUNG|nr:RNA polymerase Rpb7 [Coemansia spiralis]KAJ1994918.1 DNA-directed RNA polymerase II subunit [Coemansia umbellata]KAJ2624644.1 DNA-directed RNA polymerase II subunit [Coemansia sp. RSA 1358]KAJ2679769.1 DNA-directed RNA polymerase II subunit [Coemansia spiralis]